jgi:hypothetical protein
MLDERLSYEMGRYIDESATATAVADACMHA